MVSIFLSSELTLGSAPMLFKFCSQVRHGVATVWVCALLGCTRGGRRAHQKAHACACVRRRRRSTGPACVCLRADAPTSVDSARVCFGRRPRHGNGVWFRPRGPGIRPQRANGGAVRCGRHGHLGCADLASMQSNCHARKQYLVASAAVASQYKNPKYAISTSVLRVLPLLVTELALMKSGAGLMECALRPRA